MRLLLHDQAPKRYVLALFPENVRSFSLSRVRALKLMFEWSRALVILFVAILAVALAVETLVDVVATVYRNNPLSKLHAESFNSSMTAEESANA